jgi:hypothetical protein
MRLSGSPITDEILRKQGQTRLARGLARLHQSLFRRPVSLIRLRQLARLRQSRFSLHFLFTF